MSISSTDSRLMCNRICQAANQLIHHKLRSIVRNQTSISSTDSTLMWSTICQAADQLIHHRLRLKLSRVRTFGLQPSLNPFWSVPMFSDPIFYRFPAPTSSRQRRSSANDCFACAKHHVLGPWGHPPFTGSQKASKWGPRTDPENDSRNMSEKRPERLAFWGGPKVPGNTKTHRKDVPPYLPFWDLFQKPRGSKF